MRIVPMLSPRSQKPVPNQMMVMLPDCTYFQSYDTVIVKTTFEDGVRVVYLDEDAWKYSRTTIKYRNQFLGLTSKDVEAKVASGEFRLANLND